MKSSVKETIIFGGAFNPPTRAHQAILQACINYAAPRDADVWLLPSASRRDKEIAVPRDYRLELLGALLDDVTIGGVNVSVQTIELDRPCPTQTYTTVKELEAIYPNRRFVWVFGSDSIASMSTWNNGDRLLRHLPMLIVQRDDITYPIPAQAQPLGVATQGLSSTELRRRLSVGEAYDELVGPAVKTLLDQFRHSY